MISRVVIAGATVAAGVLTAFAATSPAGAAAPAPAPPAGCNGPTCYASLKDFITIGGSGYSPGGGSAPVPYNVPPPPCLWEKIGDATTGSEAILQAFPDVGPGDTEFNLYASWKQAKALLKAPQPGEWYELPINPAAGAAGAAACMKLPLYDFVTPGNAPPMPPIPPRDLALYAYDYLRVLAPTVTTSPAATGFVNLATFVWARVASGNLFVTVSIGHQSVTVVATAGKPVITATAGTPFNNCGPGGSRFPAGHAPATGPGAPPDCGVLWTTPVAGATITATVTWTVTWAGDGQGGRLNAIPMRTTSNPIDVQEIQSINN